MERASVDFNRIDRVLEIIQELPRNLPIKLGTGGSSLVSKYSFEYYMSLKGLYSDRDSERLSNYLMPCPFHTDKTPSFSYNSVKNVCNCFSCGCGGNSISFIAAYESKIEGVITNYYYKLEEILNTDQDIYARAGFNSIFVNLDETIDFTEFKIIKPVLKRGIQSWSYLSLQSLMKSKGMTTTADAIKFVTFMQSGVPANDIYDLMFMNKETSSVTDQIGVIFDMELDLGGFYG